MPLSAERKAAYFDTMKTLMSTYSKCFIVDIDNVGSMQIQSTRLALRGTAEVLMGKNTMMRKCIREFVEENPVRSRVPDSLGNIQGEGVVPELDVEGAGIEIVSGAFRHGFQEFKSFRQRRRRGTPGESREDGGGDQGSPHYEEVPPGIPPVLVGSVPER